MNALTLFLFTNAWRERNEKSGAMLMPTGEMMMMAVGACMTYSWPIHSVNFCAW